MTGWPETITLILVIAVVSMTLVTSLLVLVLRVKRNANTRRELLRRQRLKSLLDTVFEGEETPPLNPRDRGALIDMAVTAAHHTRGSDRDAISRWLINQDTPGTAVMMMKSRRAATRARGIELFLPTADVYPAPLEAMLEDRDLRVRALACEALGRAALVTSIPAIFAALAREDRPLPTSVVVMAITRMAPRSAALVLDAAEATGTPASVRLAIGIVGMLNLLDGRSALENYLSSPLPAFRLAALRALGQLGHPASIPTVSAFRPTSPEEAIAAANAITALGNA